MCPSGLQASQLTPVENESGGGGRVIWLLALLAVIAVAVALYVNPNVQASAPVEPADENTRSACRHWQVTVAASGVDRLDEAERRQLPGILEDFGARAEETAKTPEASQTTFLAVVEAISEARALRQARSDEVADRLPAFLDAVAAVDETCSSG